MRMYQAKDKEEFLTANSQYSDSYKANFEWLFDKTFIYENKYGKDVSEFNEEQITEFFKSRKFNKDTIRVYAEMLGKYVEWAMRANKTYRTRNLFDYLNESYYEKTATSNTKFFTREDVWEMAGLLVSNRYDELHNIQDQLLILLPFYGVGGKELFELRNLKYNDCDFENNIITVINHEGQKRNIKLSQEIMDLIKDSRNETTYTKYASKDVDPHPTQFVKNKLSDSDFIIKRNMVGNSSESDDDPLAYPSVAQRFRYIGDFLGENLKVRILEQSGMLYFAKMIYMQTGELTKDNFKPFFDRYDISKSIMIRNNKLKWIKDNLFKLYDELLKSDAK